MKDPAEYKSLGKRSTMTFVADSGVLAGARLVQTHVDGELVSQPLPQVRFGKSETGRFQTLLIESLPDRKTVRELFNEGFRHISIFGVEDTGQYCASWKN
ncbi:MAG TPA: hypothetical protein VK524_04415 [Polyangiaceae bacterium]|nr:hypothetical protein [Polyangiaceae bacterium]